MDSALSPFVTYFFTRLPWSAIDIWEKYVSWVELSLPLPPETPGSLADRSPTGILGVPQKVLIGVLDDGCPFAAAQFLAAAGKGTRVFAIWDQNPDREPVKFKDSSGRDCVFGRKPVDFQYGLEFRRYPDKIAGSVKQISLDGWIEQYRTPSGSIDEDGCYADAGFPTLRFRESHGAHVTDVLAGSAGPRRISQDPNQPPTFSPATDPASAADIVFVQFPENCIRDATGVWLKAYVIDNMAPR